MTKDEVMDIISDSGYCILGTSEGNQPRVRPMSPYLTEDGKLLVSIFAQCRTIPQITENPQVELCFVDKKMWFCRISGKAKMTEDPEKKEILWNNIPMLRQFFGGVEDPNFKVMEVEIQNVEAMTPHSQAPEIVSLV